MANSLRSLKEAFRSGFGGAANVYRAPGRVNLIGEHTDYNLGIVMPAAIDFYAWVAISPRVDRKIAIHSANYSETVEFEFDEQAPRATGHWSDYPRGVARMLKLSGLRLGGANLLIDSDVPIGAGLSSSAALEVAVGYALLNTSGISIDNMELAELCRKAENEFVGAQCGLMDQFIACHGEAGSAVMLDCRSLESVSLSLPREVVFLISNTRVQHQIASGEYNSRRSECEEGVRIIAETTPEVRSLRDVTIADLNANRGKLSETVYMRCRHVIEENERVRKAAVALDTGDIWTFGNLMYKSHQSLRDDYEVSCFELDLMVELAAGLDGVYGARLTGGGFGGCTINLVSRQHAVEIKSRILSEYENRTGIMPEVYICNPVAGVERVNEDKIQSRKRNGESVEYAGFWK